MGKEGQNGIYIRGELLEGVGLTVRKIRMGLEILEVFMIHLRVRGNKGNLEGPGGEEASIWGEREGFEDFKGEDWKSFWET